MSLNWDFKKESTHFKRLHVHALKPETICCNGGNELNILCIFGVCKVKVFAGSPNFELDNFILTLFCICFLIYQFCLTFLA